MVANIKDFLLSCLPPILIIIMLIMGMTICAVVVVIVAYLIKGPIDDNCPEEMIAQIPIYPAASFVEETSIYTHQQTGRSIRTYTTSDQPQQVLRYFHEHSDVCRSTRTCEGHIGAGFIIVNYTVAIDRHDQSTRYEVDYRWNCGQD